MDLKVEAKVEEDMWGEWKKWSRLKEGVVSVKCKDREVNSGG